jgi:hypothetical protein
VPAAEQEPSAADLERVWLQSVGSAAALAHGRFSRLVHRGRHQHHVGVQVSDDPA